MKVGLTQIKNILLNSWNFKITSKFNQLILNVIIVSKMCYIIFLIAFLLLLLQTVTIPFSQCATLFADGLLVRQCKTSFRDEYQVS